MENRNLMDPGFCKFPQTRFLYELRAHLLKLPGIVVGSCEDNPIIGSWIDFTFSGHSFTINVMATEFVFFAEDADCPSPVLDQIRNHCQQLFEDH